MIDSIIRALTEPSSDEFQTFGGCLILIGIIGSLAGVGFIIGYCIWKLFA